MKDGRRENKLTRERQCCQATKPILCLADGGEAEIKEVTADKGLARCKWCKTLHHAAPRGVSEREPRGSSYKKFPEGRPLEAATLRLGRDALLKVIIFFSEMDQSADGQKEIDKVTKYCI